MEVHSLKKIISLIIAVVFLMMSLAACSKNDSGSTDNTDSPSSNPSNYLENRDFEGYTFTFLGSNVENGISYDDPDEDYSSIHDQAVIQLNSEIMERFNIKIEDLILDRPSISEFVLTDSMSPTSSYDMGKPHGVENLSDIITQDVAFDIKALPTVDLSQPWYNQQANNEYSVMGKQYLAAAMFPGLPTSPPLLFNINMIDQANLDLPYDMILNGTWTIEEMFKYMSAGYSADSNGDGTQDFNDKYAFVGLTQSIAYFYQGFGGVTTSRDNNGAVTPILSNDTVEALYSKCMELLDHSGTYIGNLGNDDPASGHRMFYEGRGMFCYYITVALSWTDIESFDYGLGILPKYNLSQEKYCCPAGGSFVMFPVNLDDEEITGYLFEAFNEAAYRTTYPAVIQESVDFQWLRDEESIEVQKLVDQSLTFDILKNCDPTGGGMASCAFILQCLQSEIPPSILSQGYEDVYEQMFHDFFYSKK